MAAARRRQVRLGSSFEPLLRQAGLGPTDESTLLRALIVLGLAQAGIDVEPLQADILRLLASNLSPTLRTSLAGLLGSERSTPVRQLYAAQPTALEPAALPMQALPLMEVLDEPSTSPLDVGLEF